MNKITNHYFKSLFIRKKKLLLLYTFICFMGYPFIMFTDMIVHKGTSVIQITIASFSFALCVLGILAVVLPIFTFKFSMNKRNVDTYFSIPMNRSHLFKSHYVAPLLGACVPLILNYLIGGICLMFEVKNGVLVYFQLFLLLLIGIALFVAFYSFISFFVLKCNNVVDAVLISVSVIILPFLLHLALSCFMESQTANNMLDLNAIPLFVNQLLSIIYGFVEIFKSISYDYNATLMVQFNLINWSWMIYYLVVGGMFAYLAFQTFKNKKGENAEQLTTEFVTYPFMTTVGIFALMLLFNLVYVYDLVGILFSVVALFVVFVIVEGIAHRTTRVSMKSVMKFVVMMILINGFNFVSKETEFFGLNRYVVDYHDYKKITFVIDEYSDEYISTEVSIYPQFELDEDEKELLSFVKEMQAETSKRKKELNYNDWQNISVHVNYAKNENLQDENYVYFDLEEETITKLKALMVKCLEE